MESTKRPAKPFARVAALWMLLAAAVLAASRAEFLTEAAFVTLAPLITCGALLLCGRLRPERKWAAPENRTVLVFSLLFTALFFVMLSAAELLKSPLFSEAALEKAWWPLRALRLMYLAWNWAVYLPAALVSTFGCAFFAFDAFLSAPRDAIAVPAGAGGRPLSRDARCALAAITLVSACCLLSALPSLSGADTETIWYNSIRMNWSDWHPVTYRFFVKLCSLIYPSRFTVTFVQAVAWVYVSSQTVRLLDALSPRAPRAYALMLILLFTPLYMLQDMSKDVAFSTALLAMTIAMLRLVNAQKARARDFIAFGAWGYFVVSFRHAGALPVLAGAMALVVYSLAKRKRLTKGTLIAAGSALLLRVLIVDVLALGVLNAVPNPGYIKYGTPMSMIAAVAASGESFDAADEALIERVMPVEKWAACYTKYFPGTVSRAYSTIGADVYKVEEQNLGPALTKLAVKLMVTHPRAALGAFFANNAIVWKLARPTDEPVAPPDYALTAHAADPKDVSYTGLTAFTHRYAELLYDTPVLRSVSYRGGAALVALLFSAVVLWLKGRARDALCTLPVLAVWAGLMLAVPSPSPRYALPLWQCALLFLTWTYYVPREPK